MEKFEFITDALRDVKRLVNDDLSLGIHYKVFLMSDHNGESFYVTNDDSDIDEYLTDNFYEDSADWSPEDWARNHEIYVYEHAGNKEDFPSIYGLYKNHLLIHTFS